MQLVFAMVISWNDPGDSEAAIPKIPAAEYVRMSTDHQQYSTDNQTVVIRKWAEEHGYEIVRTYADEGKSGLNLHGRSSLQRLLADVEDGSANFQALLVYDVSRLGRFQDTDEAGMHEHLIRRAGVVVEYCGEQWRNDGSTGSSMMKSMKRVMAADYSQALSVKVFAGQANLIRLGFRQGGAAGFGLRRLLIDQSGKPKSGLGAGEHKSIATDRVILVPGPPEEIAIVRDVYRQFLIEGHSEREIAAILNSRAILTDRGVPWSRGAVHQLLVNEKYVGNNVWARTSCKLKGDHVANAPATWVRADGAFAAIIDKMIFEKVALIIAARSARTSDDEMLAKLRAILAENGTLSGLIIDEFEDAPSSGVYRQRFGSLLRAYALVGFAPAHDYRYLDTNRMLRALHPTVVATVIDGLRAAGGEVIRDATTDLLTINREFTASVVVVRSFATSAGSLRWKVRLDTALGPDITVAIRMDGENQSMYDYYLLPRLDMREAAFRLFEDNGLSLDAYRFETLAPLYQMAARQSFPRAA